MHHSREDGAALIPTPNFILAVVLDDWASAVTRVSQHVSIITVSTGMQLHCSHHGQKIVQFLLSEGSTCLFLHNRWQISNSTDTHTSPLLIDGSS